MIRGTNIAPGEVYHIYSRGVDKRIIFSDDHDKDRFVKLLYLCNSSEKIDYRSLADFNVFELQLDDNLVYIGAYCIMDNHFHLMLKEVTEGGVSKFMHKLLTSYAMYFNKKNDRLGTLFQNRFQAKHCNCDIYLKYLFAYIHLNPVKMIAPNWKEKGIRNTNKVKNFLRQYKYSSLNEYYSPNRFRDESKIISRKEFPDYFEKNDFESHIEFWLKYRDVCKDL